MAATVANRTESALTSAGTSFTVNFTQTTGDLVIACIALATSTTITVGDSFTNWTNANTNLHLIYKVLDGSEGGTVVVTIGASTKAAATAYNIQNFSGTPEPTTPGAAVTGADTTPDPPNLTPSGGSQDYLWIACFRQAGEEADDDTWCTAAPTNFTNLLQKTSGVGGAAASNCSVGSAEFTSTASSLDPGTFTVAQSLAWSARTIAVNPSGAAAPEDPFPYIGGSYYPTEG